MSDATYVLVHGAWGGGWYWNLVGAELTRRDVNWTALDLPSSTHGAHPNTYLHDDAREVIEIAKTEGPIVLVGHSYGGAVITEAADQLSNLEQLVYVAAYIPLLGQSVSEANQEVTNRTLLDEAIEVEGEFLRLNADRATAALYQDCSEGVSAWAASQLTSQTIASFRSPRSSFDVDVPSRYILCTQDQAVDPRIQTIMAERGNKVTMLESGHSPMLSHPDLLCDLILTRD
jgi:pimeloyl-ACP methyl ester carboxylesterase